MHIHVHLGTRDAGPDFKAAAERVMAKARSRMAEAEREARRKKDDPDYDPGYVSMLRSDARSFESIAKNLSAGNLNNIKAIIRRMDSEPLDDVLSVMPRSIDFGW